MLSFSDVNVVAVLVAAAAVMALGMAWYSVLSGPWQRLTKLHPADMKGGMAQPLLMQAAATLLMVLALSLLIGALVPETIAQAWTIAVLVWLGFTLPGGISEVAWEHRPPALIAMNAGYELLGALLAATIVFLWPW